MNRVSLVVASFVLASTVTLNSASADPLSSLAGPHNWGGFYIGANVGNGWTPPNGIGDVAYSDDGSIGTVANGWFTGLNKSNGNALIGGLQAGYNYQINRIVYGIETDLDFGGARNKYHANDVEDIIPFPGAVDPPDSEYNYHLRENLTATTKLAWFGSIRPRIGIAATNRLLVYATGGLAFGGVKSSANYNWHEYGYWWATPVFGQDGFFDRNGGFQGSQTKVRFGWTLGAGAEYALTDHVSLRAEYLYMDLGSKRHTIYFTGEGNDESISWKDTARFHTLRLAINYKF